MKLRHDLTSSTVIFRWDWVLFVLLCTLTPTMVLGGEPLGPEATLRVIVEANAARDLATMSKYMSHDADAVGYTIDGHKYVGWPALEADMRSEFSAVHKLELPITYLQVWQKGEVAWFAMELDYIRYLSARDPSQRMVIPLRETGVLERRNDAWVLVAWHESGRQPDTGLGSLLTHQTTLRHRTGGMHTEGPTPVDLRGEWDITEVEDNKNYRATLDAQGNGPYTWQGGQIATTQYDDRRWRGTWTQSENDREGGFEVVLSDDGTEAKGIWWYERVGTRANIPPRQHGGSYLWKRLSLPSLSQ
ncbi:MAG: nuclear transport factor 2 family protein [Nitrospira sp.]